MSGKDSHGGSTAPLGTATGLDRMRLMLKGARGWRRAGLAFMAGAVSVLAMAPFFLWPVLFVTVPALVFLIDGSPETGHAPRERLRDAAAGGWWFGFGYFLLGLFWIGEAFLVEADKFAWLLPFAVTLLPAGLALFFAAAAAAARIAWAPGVSRILVLAVALSSFEWLRGHVLTGFPWNVPGYALTYPLALMQSAGLLGIYGLTTVAIIVFAAPLVLMLDAPAGPARRQALTRGGVIAALPLAAMFTYGAIRLSPGAPPDVEGVRIRIVQPSIPQREKWLPDKQGAIFLEHLELSRRNAQGTTDNLAGITHLIWPEAAMPFRPLDHPEALAEIGKLLPQGTFLLSGGLRVVSGPDGTGRTAYNSLMGFGENGALASVYDKIHLVPFGEYLPMQQSLEALGLEQLTRMRGGFTPGITPRPLFRLGALGPFGVLVCYEAIFPAAAIQGEERPGVLINVTNDGWFGNTTGPRQHFHQTRLRAVEEGVPILRAANNGISAAIDPYGRVLADLGMNEKGVIDTPLPAAIAPPPYARFGDWIFLALLTAVAVTAGLTARQNP